MLYKTNNDLHSFSASDNNYKSYYECTANIIAQIEVDSTQLKEYNAALKEQMQTAVRWEPGVLTYYAVADKKLPSRITILEIYADSAAYQKHITTPHFKKYKTTVAHMVKKLELVEVDLIGSAKQPGL